MHVYNKLPLVYPRLVKECLSWSVVSILLFIHSLSIELFYYSDQTTSSLWIKEYLKNSHSILWDC